MVLHLTDSLSKYGRVPEHVLGTPAPEAVTLANTTNVQDVQHTESCTSKALFCKQSCITYAFMSPTVLLFSRVDFAQ